MAQYSSCADANGPLNNSVVYLCADKVIEIAQRDAEEKISALRRTNLKQDIEVLLEAQELWAAYVQEQCELQGKYVGSAMVSYCPMLKWIERNEELDLLLGSLSENFPIKIISNDRLGFPGTVLSNPRRHGYISPVSCS